MKKLFFIASFFLFYNLQVIEAQSIKELKNIVLTDDDWNNRIMAINKITDQRVLYEIIKTSNNTYLNGFVVRNITDTLILREIALSENGMIVFYVLKKINDQEIIKKALLNNTSIFIDSIMCYVSDESFKEELVKNTDNNIFLRCSAVKYSKSQEFKSKIALDKNYDEYIRSAAISTLTDQNIIYSLLKKGESYQIKRAAIDALTNQDFLEDIAINESILDIQGKAIIKLSNDKVLQNITETYPYYPASLANIRWILNNSFIKNKYGLLNIEFMQDTNVYYYQFDIRLITHNLEISIFDSTGNIKIFHERYNCEVPNALPFGSGGNVFAKIDYIKLCKFFLSFENDTLKMIAAQTTSKYLKEAALSIISQNKIIEDVGRNKNDDIEKIIATIEELDIDQRSKALKELKNKDFSEYFARNDKSDIIRSIACLLIVDQNLLYEIAITDEENKVREEALNQLNDQQKIADIVVNADICELVYNAIEKLNDQEAITYVLKSEWKIDYCMDAKSKLMKKAQNSEVIEYVLLNDKSAVERQNALKYVSNQEVIKKIATTPFKEFEFTQLRFEAILKLTDKEILKKLKKDDDKNVRIYAKIRLSRL